MGKGKLGLQKEVSKIFTGIQIPKKNDAGPDARSTAPAKTIIPTPEVTERIYNPPPVTPAEPVVTPPVEEVLTSTEPVQEAVVTAPPTPTPTPTPAPAPVRPVIHQPIVTGPKPFMIPEPPASHDDNSKRNDSVSAPAQPTRQVVYEPPTPRQTSYDSPSSSESMSPAAKLARAEAAFKPKDSQLFKIIEKIKTKLLNSKYAPKTPKQKLMLLLAPVLVIILIIVVANSLKKPSKAVAATTKKTTAASDTKITWEIPAVIPNNLRDPMVFGSVSAATGKDTSGGPVVKGIVYSDDNPCAVVGDRIVSAGDVVAGAKVDKINRDSVEFSMGDKKWTQKVER